MKSYDQFLGKNPAVTTTHSFSFLKLMLLRKQIEIGNVTCE